MSEFSQVDDIKLKKFFLNDLDGDLKVFTYLFDLLKGQFRELEQFTLEKNNLDQLGMMAHKLISAAKSFAAAQLVKDLIQLEGLAREKNYSGASELYPLALNNFSASLTEIDTFIQAYR